MSSRVVPGTGGGGCRCPEPGCGGGGGRGLGSCCGTLPCVGWGGTRLHCDVCLGHCLGALAHPVLAPGPGGTGTSEPSLPAGHLDRIPRLNRGSGLSPGGHLWRLPAGSAASAACGAPHRQELTLQSCVGLEGPRRGQAGRSCGGGGAGAGRAEVGSCPHHGTLVLPAQAAAAWSCVAPYGQPGPSSPIFPVGSACSSGEGLQRASCSPSALDPRLGGAAAPSSGRVWSLPVLSCEYTASCGAGPARSRGLGTFAHIGCDGRRSGSCRPLWFVLTGPSPPGPSLWLSVCPSHLRLQSGPAAAPAPQRGRAWGPARAGSGRRASRAAVTLASLGR